MKAKPILSKLLISFVLINLTIAYLGRWSMERRFRPHLEH